MNNPKDPIRELKAIARRLSYSNDPEVSDSSRLILNWIEDYALEAHSQRVESHIELDCQSGIYEEFFLRDAAHRLASAIQSTMTKAVTMDPIGSITTYSCVILTPNKHLVKK